MTSPRDQGVGKRRGITAKPKEARKSRKQPCAGREHGREGVMFLDTRSPTAFITSGDLALDRAKARGHQKVTTYPREIGVGAVSRSRSISAICSCTMASLWSSRVTSQASRGGKQ